MSTLNPPALDWFADLSVQVGRPQEVGHTVHGQRRLIPILGGEATGQGWTARVLPGGADFQLIVNPRLAELDARYMLESDDGVTIYMQNKGYLWGREPGTMERLRAWAFDGGEAVPHADYYLRAQPTFEAPLGKYDWLTRHVFIGVGERKPDGNYVKYYRLT